VGNTGILDNSLEVNTTKDYLLPSDTRSTSEFSTSVTLLPCIQFTTFSSVSPRIHTDAFFFAWI
jgi:hypothetical protein